jgi:hypothetical protein
MSEMPPDVRVSRVLGTGEIELETDNPDVRDRAIESHLNEVPETFVYWTGTAEDVVTVRVSSASIFPQDRLAGLLKCDAFILKAGPGVDAPNPLRRGNRVNGRDNTRNRTYAAESSMAAEIISSALWKWIRSAVAVRGMRLHQFRPAFLALNAGQN